MGNLSFIYADNAATTPLLPEAAQAMAPYYTECFGNPSSPYAAGRRAKTALENARQTAASLLGTQKSELFFTSGGTESNNWAIRSVLQMKAAENKRHLIVSSIEHPSVLKLAQEYERRGGSVTFLPVGENGIVDPDSLRHALTPSTALVSVMAANNEIGTLQPIEALGRICREAGVLFHTDAVQAVGHIPLDLSALPVDLLSFSGHKFGGPKGIGGLFIRSGILLPPLLLGGEQEREKRPGTENVPAIAGLACALESACQSMDANSRRVLALRERLIDGALKIPGSSLNGDRRQRLPGNANFCFEGIEGESLLLMLDMRGICCSSGSACSTGAADPSHVLLALGIPRELARSSLRVTLSHLNTAAEVDRILRTLTECIDRLRGFRPV